MKKLRVLHIEDSERDVAIISRTLASAEYDTVSKRVENAEDLCEALTDNEWDVILCDYSMPKFDALDALAVLQRMEIDIPFIVISGTIGEDIAVKAMVAGANDYLMKDKLIRLVPAIEREIQEAENRRKAREVQKTLVGMKNDLEFAVKGYERVLDNSLDVICSFDGEGRFASVNHAARETWGYEPDELIGKLYMDLVHPEDHEITVRAATDIMAGHPVTIFENRYLHKDGSIVHVMWSAKWLDSDRKMFCVARDITDRKQAEAIRFEREQEFEALVENAPDIVSRYDDKFRHLYVNRAIEQATGLPASAYIGKTHGELGMPPHLQAEWNAVLGDVFASGKERETEFEFPTPGGRRFYHSRLVPEFAPDTSVRSVLNIARDITDRKASEEKLIRSQANLARAQQIAHLGSWEMELPLKTNGGASPLRWSDEVFRIFGYKPGEIEVSNENFFLAAHPDDRENIKATMGAALKGGNTYSLDHRIIRPDGTQRVVHEHSEIVSDPETGEPVKMIGTVQDVTEQKNLERELSEIAASNSESLALIGTILSRAPIGFAYHDLDLRYVRINETLAAINGSSVEDHLGRTLAEILPKMAPVLEPILLRVIDTGEPMVDFEMSGETRAEPGNPKHWLVSFYPVRNEGGEVLGVGVLVSEVTERKRAEEELRESEEKFSGAFEFAPIGVALVLPDGRWLKVNRALCDLIGYTEAELLTLTVQDLTPVDDLDETLKKMNLLLSGEIPDYEMEKRYIHKLGHPVSVRLHVSLVRHPNGDPRYFIAHIQDITEQKAAQHQLQLHSLILNSIGQSVIVSDGSGIITYWNRFAEKMYGWPASEATGRNVIDITPTQASRARGVEILDALKRGEGWSGEFTVQNRSGISFPIFVTNTPLMNAAGEVESIIGISIDVTERKKAEEELRESEALLAASQRITHLGSWVMDISESGEVIKDTERWSDEHYRIFGFEPGEVEITDELFYGAVHPDDREPLVKLLQETIEHQHPYDLEHRIILPDGTERIVHAMAEVVIDDKTGKVTKLLGSVQDITERKRIGEEIQRRQTELRALFDVMPAMVWFKDTENNLLRVNQRVADAAGLAVEEIEGKPAAEIYPDESAEFFADDLKVLESGKPKLGYEEMLPGGNGDKRWVQTDKVPYFDSDGKPIGIIVMAQDVTERKNAEEALRESEENFRQLAENINDSFWIRSPDLNEIHYISPAFEKIWGRSLESVNATPHEWLNFILPEDREHVREAYERLMGSAPTIDIEYRIVRADDEVRWVRTRGFQVRNEDGELIRLAGIVTDITESKKAIEALGESEERYRELVENAIDVIYTLDLKGNYTSINRASVGLTGYTVEESLSRNIVESMAPEYREKARQLLEAQIHGEDLSAFELEIIAKDGRRIALELKTRPIIENGVPVGVQGIARDVTERKVAREQLEQSSAQLRIAGQAAHLGGWSIELPERTLTWTDENCRIHDVEPGYVPTLDESVETYYSEHRDEVMGYVNDCAENGTPYDFERPIITAKGRHIWVRVIGEAVRDEDGKIVRLQGAIQDITDRKQAEEALRQKESLIRIAGELTRTGGWAVELPTNQVFWSDEISDILELPRGEIPELERALELYPQSSRDKVVAGLEACSKDGTPLDIEVEIDTATGRRIWVRVCAEADRKVDGTITRIQGAFQDISERKGIESQLRQAQKLESVGLLAGGIAHDFNNMLTAITGYSELTLRRMAEDDPLRGNLIEIKNAGDRSAALTNQLLAFSRQQILQPEVVVINQIIAETVNMLGRLIGENIQLVTILNPKVGQVKADPGQLSQILTNLAVNARDAMPDGGKLTFETSNAFLEDEYAGRQVDVLPGAYVMFAVSDTGTGMDVETQEHIFEPFYTTKGVGKGTGLGLATVYGIVKQSNGHILVYSEPGMGTTFKIYLPRVVDDSEKAETARTSDKLPIGTETILLVEDEEMVRKFTRQTLEMCGYTVIEAGNGSDALAIFESDPGRVNLVMADIVMPGMGGRELAEKISLSWPEMPVLFTSGYTDDAVVRHGVVNSDANFIQKPFATDALARKVRDIFDGVEKA